MSSVALIDVDPQLGAELPASELELARRTLVVPELRLRSGHWDPEPLTAHWRSALGLLVLDGTLAHTTTLGERTTTQLFGAGDVLRPWGEEPVDCPGTLCVGWTALTPCSLALLDRRLISIVARWPSILIDIAARVTEQHGRVTRQVALARVPRIEERLLMLFWELGNRWGRMTMSGVLVPIPLTHETIAGLVAASRPPVSTALAQLARDGQLRKTTAGWVLDPAVERQLHAVFTGASASPLPAAS